MTPTDRIVDGSGLDVVGVVYAVPSYGMGSEYTDATGVCRAVKIVE